MRRRGTWQRARQRERARDKGYPIDPALGWRVELYGRQDQRAAEQPNDSVVLCGPRRTQPRREEPPKLILGRCTNASYCSVMPFDR